MNKKCFFTIADNNNLVHYEKLKNSLAKFHPDVELRLFGEDFVKSFGDPAFYYRATPILAMKLFNEGYDQVCKLDADQIITGSLTDIWEGDYDASCVLNDPTYPIAVWDITHPNYYNAGLVLLKSKEFTFHWLRLCHSPHFDRYQMREQDLLNIMASDYMNYKVRNLDEGINIYGESAKPLWSQAVLKGNDIMIGDRKLYVIHFGGGNNPQKGNYRTKFNEEIINKIDQLIK